MFCHRRFCLLVIIQVLVLLMNLGNGQNQSVPHNETGFPFQLVKPKPDSDPCGYISVDPFCSSSSKDETMVEFPTIPALRGVRFPITDVNYFDYVVICDPENCLPRIFLQLYNSPIRPFLLEPGYPETHTNITFFDCPASCPIYAADFDESILRSGLGSCTEKFQLVSQVSASYLESNRLALRWSQPKCDVEKHKPNKIPIMVLPPTGSIVLVLLFIAFLKIYCYFRMKGDDQARLENFLEDYKALKPTRFSYADLKRITNHFKDKLGEGAHGEVFKGKLSPEILVAVKLLNNAEGDGKEFINEVGTMGKIHHINVVRLLGFCADGFHRALVYDFFSNG